MDANILDFEAISLPHDVIDVVLKEGLTTKMRAIVGYNTYECSLSDFPAQD